MSLLPLTLGVKRNIDAQGAGKGKSKKKPPLNREQLAKTLNQQLADDKFTCRYCAFQSRTFQKVIPKDWGVSDPRGAELVTACMFCEQCLALETVAPMGSGALVWLPEIEQTALHHLMRAAYVVRGKEKSFPKPIVDAANRAFDVLSARRGEAKRRIGTDDPAVLASTLLENVSPGIYQQRHERLAGVRLLPLEKRIIIGPDGEGIDQFPRMLDAWMAEGGAFANLPAEQWEKIGQLPGAKDKAA